MLVAVLTTIVTALANGLVNQGTSGLQALPLDHLAFQPNSDATFSRSTLTEPQLRTWRQHDPTASPVGMSFLNASQVGRQHTISLALFGVQSRSFLVTRPVARAALAGPPGLVLSSTFRSQGVRVGQRYRIAGTNITLPVLGFTYAGSYGHVAIGFTSLDSWQRIAYGNDPRGRFSAIALRLRSELNVAAIDRAAGTETMTKTAAYAGSPGYTAETATMSMIRAFLVVISALMVGAFFTVLTLQRTKQIGVLKAMGASSSYVVRDGLAQIAVIVVLATAAGAAIGSVFTALVQGGTVPLSLSATGVARSGLILAIAGVAGGAVALRRVAGVEPAIALGVEG